MDWNAAYGWSEGMELTGKECFSRTFITPTIHGINMWRTSLVKQFALGNNADYNKMNADEYIQRLLFLNSRKVVFSGGVYFYKYNGQSITKGFSIRQLGYLDSCRKFIGLIDEYHLNEPTASIIKEYYFMHVIHLQIRLYQDKSALNIEERREMKQTIKAAYTDAMRYKNAFRFREKRMPHVYAVLSTNGYALFCLTCWMFACYLNLKIKVYKK